jgi:4-carboxymuconolactone decarboxylase
MADDLAKKGLELRTKLFGEKAAVAGNEFLKQFDEGFATFLNEQLFGGIWTRPGLETKIRSLITMTALMALGRGPELRLHMRGALNIGVTQQEIKEMIIHISQYSGVPTAVEAIRAFREVTEPKKT